jgi:hypothetical protein
VKVEDFRDKKDPKKSEQMIQEIREALAQSSAAIHKIEKEFNTQIEVVITEPPSEIESTPDQAKPQSHSQ